MTYKENLTIPENYKHWTIKEIYEQPDSLNRCLLGRLNYDTIKLGGLEENINTLREIDNVVLLGCGTSFHSCLAGMSYLKDLCNFYSVTAFDGAEFTELDIPKGGKTTFILISQSGETKDLHRCIKIANNHDIFYHRLPIERKAEA